MGSRIHEWFGFPADADVVPGASGFRQNKQCPFVEGECIKHIQVEGERKISGVCSIKPQSSEAVVTCPHRMYAEDYKILSNVARIAFGESLELVSSGKVCEVSPQNRFVAVFGQRWGRELRLPKRKGKGSYSVDWILALLDRDHQLLDFTAVEVQTIDTTGNYRNEVLALDKGSDFTGTNTANPNWENVNKRILPQIIYKGHVLRREPKCTKGLFFVCPTPVYERIMDRLGGVLDPIHPSTGSVTFLHYGLAEHTTPAHYPLVGNGQLTTTVDQVALAFTAPKDLPPVCSYEKAIHEALSGYAGFDQA